jgi:hypothetical protein
MRQRREQSAVGLGKVRERAAECLPEIVKGEPLAIYVTGSFGRREGAFPGGSDLDLFFLYDPPDRDPSSAFSRLTFFELATELIRLGRELGFPEFSGDGEYLVVHNVRYIGEQLGSPIEDAENVFTARLLLLLESQPIYNDELYQRMLQIVIGFYLEDFEQNASSFRPTFLLNDISRFWRTLCLNYENKRRSKHREAQEQDAGEDWRAKSALENFKLRFSRLSTCFSMVAALGSEPTPVTAQRVFELCRTPASERWGVAVNNASQDRRDRAGALHGEMVELYEFFLEQTADKAKALAALAAHGERTALRERANRYGELVSELLITTCTDEQRRTLLV